MAPPKRNPTKQPASTASDAASDPPSPPPQEEHSAITIREFSPEQNTALQARFNSLNTAIDAKIDDRFNKIISHIKEWMSSAISAAMSSAKQAAPTPESDVLETTETPHLPPHPPIPAETPPTSYRLKPKDVGFFNPDTPDEHGLRPVTTVGSETVYRDIYTWVERLKDLMHSYGPDEVKWIIQPCLRGSAAT